MAGSGLSTGVGAPGAFDGLSPSAAVTGSPGDDALNGTDGDDVISGLGGNDVINAGAGNDVVDPGPGIDTVNAGPGDDVIRITSILIATPAPPPSQIDGGQGVDTIDASGLSIPLDWSLDRPTGAILLANYRFSNVEALIGSSGADRFIALASAGLVSIDGRDGDDVIETSAGATRLAGGAGNDTISGGSNSAVVTGDAGDDVIAVNGGGQALGGDGDDQFLVNIFVSEFTSPTEYQTRIDGGAGIDTIRFTGTGRLDLTEGAVFTSVLVRRLGQPSLPQTVRSFTITGVENVEGYGQIRGDAAANWLRVPARGSEAATFSGEAGDDLLQGGAQNDTLTGGDGNDRLEGNGADDVLSGDAGDDVLTGGDGTDSLTGGSDQDVLTGGLGSDRLDGGAGIDTASFSEFLKSGVSASLVTGIAVGMESGSDTLIGIENLIGTQAGDLLTGDDGSNMLSGRGGDDFLNGGGGNDTLDGGDGADQLTGGAGADILTGGAGNDTFVVGPGDSPTGSGTDLITDFQAGFDRLDISGIGASLVSILYSPGYALVLASGAGNVISVQGEIGMRDIFADGENPAGFLTGDPSRNIITGGAANDTINGAGGDDILSGGGGADSLLGGPGSDSLTGGAGADTFLYGVDNSTAAGADTIGDFESGQDKLDLSATEPRVTTLVRSGPDTLLFSQGASGPQTQILVKGTAIQGADLVLQSSGAARGIDFLGQDDVADMLVGTSGADTLFGLSGSDTLNGGAGDDRLFGDAGGDILVGGAGTDRFAYRGFADSNATSGYDIVTDFVSGTDKIDLFFLNGLQTVSLVRSTGGPSCLRRRPAGRCRWASQARCRGPIWSIRAARG